MLNPGVDSKVKRNIERDSMKIGELAKAAGVSVDTLRYYEKLALIEPPVRMDNGYRLYGAQHLERMRFIRSAHALGFSLTQIGTIIPRLAAGLVSRETIERQLQVKLAEIDTQITALQTLKADLHATIASLSCPPGVPMSTAAVTGSAPAIPGRLKKSLRP